MRTNKSTWCWSRYPALPCEVTTVTVIPFYRKEVDPRKNATLQGSELINIEHTTFASAFASQLVLHTALGMKKDTAGQRHWIKNKDTFKNPEPS